MKHIRSCKSFTNENTFTQTLIYNFLEHFLAHAEGYNPAKPHPSQPYGKL